MSSDKMRLLCGALQPFSMDVDALRSYLFSLNSLPIYDIVSNLYEVMLVVEDSDEFDSDRKELVRSFYAKVMGLAPAEDSFWSFNGLDERWTQIRADATYLLSTLPCE